MNLGRGFLFSAGLAFVVTGCAAGGGGGTASAPAPTTNTPAAAPAQSAEAGARPREDEFTRAAQNYLDEAFTEEARGNADAAEAAYVNAVVQGELAVDSDPSNPRAHLVLAEAYLGAGQFLEAGEAFGQALELRPAYAEETQGLREEAWVQIYQTAAPLVQSQEYDRAIELFTAADAIYEERPEVKIILGQLLAQTGEYDEAVSLLMEANAIIEGPRIEEVDTATAASWRAQQEDINPTIAQALLFAERYADVIPVLEDLMADEPDNVEYALSLATSYREEGRTEEAIGLYESVSALDGLTARNYLNLGIGLYQLNEYLAAADAFQRAAEVSPNSRDALEFAVNSLQLIYAGTGAPPTPPADAERWMDMAQRWVDLDPANPRAYTALAQAMVKMESEEAPQIMNTAQQLPVLVTNLQMTVTSSGASVMGQVARGTTEESSVTLRFTFYNQAGAAIGTEEVTVDLPATADATAQISVQFQSPGGQVAGYGYEVVS